MNTQSRAVALPTIQRLSLVITAMTFIVSCSSIQRYGDSHSATVSDTATDPNHPSRGAAFTIISSGAKMNAQFYLASGARNHPTMLLLHGTPGNEQNLDLAQAVRRAGWNVLTVHYRGSWGSEGDYSISNALSDTNAAMDFLLDPRNTDKYKIDVKTLVVAGHSTGGFNAAVYAAGHPQIAGVVLLDAWNAGPPKEPYSASARSAFIARVTQGSTSLVIRASEAYVDDYIAQAPLTKLATNLSALPVLIVGAEKANGSDNKALAAAIGKIDGTRLQMAILPTDHPFSDRRIELTNILLKWLDRISGLSN